MEKLKVIAPLESGTTGSIQSKINELVAGYNDLRQLVERMAEIGQANNTGPRLAQLEQALKLDPPPAA